MTVLLSAQGLTKSYGHRPLFAGLNFDLRAGERVGLIGPNGAGKSTLLRLLAAHEDADAGSRSVRRGARIGYLAQDDTFAPGLTVREILLAALADDPLEDHERETRTAITLTQVGFADDEQPAAALSGGWRKRLALARELVRKPDLLLLDEPTNHLDLPGVVWLERLLRAAPFGYLVATHDRAFLRAVADEIVEISRVYPGGSFRAAGGYDDFADKREEFLEAQARQQAAVANVVRRETEWLGHKARARTRKASSRIEDAAKRRDQLDELKYRTAQAGAAGIDFASTGRQTRKLLTATGLAKTLGSRSLFSNLDVTLTPGTKLGLLGPNGSGKSTLLRVLAGQLDSDTGTVARADGLRAVMFEQGRAALDQTQPLRKALCPNGDTVVFGDRSLHVAAWAQRFLFRPEQLNLEISALSGGEQARVRIAQLMLQPADLLLLDEPTNDLDIPALEVLEDSLSDFPGAVVLVSHDRELMDRVCTEVIGLDGRGGAASYGSVGQWLTACERVTAEAETAARAAATPAKKAPTAAPKTKKLSYKEQQEWDRMEDAILTAEAEVASCQADVEKAATAGQSVLVEACRALDHAQRAVEGLYARWQELEAKRSGS
ncbi:ABC-F family ATP-binding cassette domain-containing protein [Fimbriiglobus ruber]|uniref:ATPase component of ABC transporter n=1 Tax=Fimbriiglobus ruber TaxID=1908690 RepID=A0A225DW59_9BACT|nr:ABC-F family ATP-binding cassette domain-containing protein [Fimbriiglobus ruber]OWK40437.1 ATPase component of ABC transporter [Fimbriiglobus ruber]